MVNGWLSQKFELQHGVRLGRFPLPHAVYFVCRSHCCQNLKYPKIEGFLLPGREVDVLRLDNKPTTPRDFSEVFSPCVLYSKSSPSMRKGQVPN